MLASNPVAVECCRVAGISRKNPCIRADSCRTDPARRQRSAFRLPSFHHLSSVFRHLSSVFCLLPSAFCLLPSAFRHLSSVICLPSSVFRLPSSVLRHLSSVFCLLTSVFCLLSSVTCLLSSVFRHLSSVFRLPSSVFVFCHLSSVFCLLSSVFCLLSSVFCLPSSVFRLPSSSFRRRAHEHNLHNVWHTIRLSIFVSSPFFDIAPGSTRIGLERRQTGPRKRPERTRTPSQRHDLTTGVSPWFERGVPALQRRA
jgi:hypothetical protein